MEHMNNIKKHDHMNIFLVDIPILFFFFLYIRIDLCNVNVNYTCGSYADEVIAPLCPQKPQAPFPFVTPP